MKKHCSKIELESKKKDIGNLLIFYLVFFKTVLQLELVTFFGV